MVGIYSNLNRTGFVTTSDSTLAFVPSNAPILPNQEVDSLISELKSVLQNNSLTSLQKKQYQTQLTWLEQSSNVPEIEIIAHSTGLVNLANNTNYMSMLVGLLVSTSL